MGPTPFQVLLALGLFWKTSQGPPMGLCQLLKGLSAWEQAIHNVEPVWKGERGSRCLGTSAHSGFPFLLETTKTNKRTPLEWPPRLWCLHICKTGSQRAEHTIVSLPPVRSPTRMELTFPSLQPLLRVGPAEVPAAHCSVECGGANPSPKRLINCSGLAGSPAGRSVCLLLLSSIAHHKPDLTMELPRKFSSKL